MSRTMMRGALLALIAVAAFVGGVSIGQRRSMDMLLSMMASETTGNLAHRVETLARIRTGYYAGAIAWLEQAVDTATTTLPMGKPWNGLDRSAQSALQLAKAYRSVYPPAATETALVQLLETVPMPAVEYCSPALQEGPRRWRATVAALPASLNANGLSGEGRCVSGTAPVSGIDGGGG